MSDVLQIHPIRQFDVELEVPGDKSMSHRAAIIAGLAEGHSRIRNFLPSEDCLNTLHAMETCGVETRARRSMPGFGPTEIEVHGRRMALSAPQAPIDCGNSGTGMRLLAGLLAAQPFASELFGDASLSSRPMNRIIAPLREMGVLIDACGERAGCAPLRISPASIRPITYELPMASAQVKSAILLAGLYADGVTTVIEPATTRDHTERMFEAFGMEVTSDGPSISLRGGQVPQARDFYVPGDISSAAFWIVAAAARPGARLKLRRVGLNPTRTAVLDVIERMGAGVIRRPEAEATGEIFGEVEIHGAALRGTDLTPEEIPNLIDEIPVIAVAAALATGKTQIRNARELRVKETDRIATTVENLRAMGGLIEEFDDGMEIHGGTDLHGTELTSHGDHRLAMAFAVAGLFADGPTQIKDTACIHTSYPGFSHHLAAVLNEARDPAAYALPSEDLKNS